MLLIAIVTAKSWRLSTEMIITKSIIILTQYSKPWQKAKQQKMLMQEEFFFYNNESWYSTDVGQAYKPHTFESSN